jgi:hypothetical protein
MGDDQVVGFAMDNAARTLVVLLNHGWTGVINSYPFVAVCLVLLPDVAVRPHEERACHLIGIGLTYGH